MPRQPGGPSAEHPRYGAEHRAPYLEPTSSCPHGRGAGYSEVPPLPPPCHSSSHGGGGYSQHPYDREGAAKPTQSSYPPQYHHTYAAHPGKAPYADPTHRYVGYDQYYGGDGWYPHPNQLRSKAYNSVVPPPLPSSQPPHRVDPSPRDEEVEEGVAQPVRQHQHQPAQQLHEARQIKSRGPPQPQPQPEAPAPPAAAQDETTKAKKPPRPYTEYNIFFQLERERILGELEEEQRKKKEADGSAQEDTPKKGGGSKEAKEDDGTKQTNTSEEEGPKPEEDKVQVKQTKTEAENLADNQNVNKQDANAESNTPDTKKEEDDRSSHGKGKQATPEPSSTFAYKEGAVLNEPSDANDILPRPPRFAHLKLAPLWYDSTHRLAQSKLNKSRRKHRKTHGLVGFLDLTRRIAKAWGEADPETRSYCRRVADRQLRIYKEELKQLKKRQGSATAASASQGAGAHAKPRGRDLGLAQREAMARARESAAMAAAAPTITPAAGEPQAHPYPAAGGSKYPPQEAMRPPPPPPPPGSRSHAAAGYGKYWGHPPPQQQHAGYLHHQPAPYQGYPAPHHQAQSYRSHPTSNRGFYPPALPPLTPDASSYVDDRSFYSNGASHTPLDELMHRRKLYGSRVGSLPSSRKRRRERAAKADTHHPSPEEEDEEAVAAKQAAETLEELASSPGAGAGADRSKSSYLSPSDLDVGTPKEAFHKAITPSPSRRHAAASSSKAESRAPSGSPTGSSPTSTAASAALRAPPPPSSAMAGGEGGSPVMTPGTLPMKKRRKVLERGTSSGGSDPSQASKSARKAILGRGSSTGSSLTIDQASPDSASSPLFALSPSGMMTPRSGAFGASPLSGGSGEYRKALAPYLEGTGPGDSPFPYIDWGSPQEEDGPHDTKDADVPPHLAVPGSFGHPPPGAHPSSHYPGAHSHPHPHHPYHCPSRHHPPTHHRPPPYPAHHLPPGSPYLTAHDDFADADVLDLDEEEMQLLWRRLAAKRARRKRMRDGGRHPGSRGGAHLWAYHHHAAGHGSFAASPGGLPSPGVGAAGSSRVRMAHSFSSPAENRPRGRPGLAARDRSGGSIVAAAEAAEAAAAMAGAPSVPGTGEEEEEKEGEGAVDDASGNECNGEGVNDNGALQREAV
ncbi:hypothetical protein ACHAWF_015855 [Thalassiosira exigua]